MLVQLTIAPRAGRELGYVRMKMDPIKFNEGMLTYVFFFFFHLFEIVLNGLSNISNSYQ